MSDTLLPENPALLPPEEPAEIIYDGRKLEIMRGTTIAELMRQYPSSKDEGAFAALMNNRLVSLRAPIVRSGRVEPINYASRHGARIYRRHLTLMLYEAFYSLHPNARIRVGQAISEGYYFEVTGTEVNAVFIAEIKAALGALAAEKRPFTFRRVPVEEARRLFVYEKSDFKKKVLDHWPNAYVSIMSIGSFVDFALGPVAPHTGYFKEFDLFKQGDDMILQFPNPRIPQLHRNDGPQPKLYATLKDSRRWSQRLGVGHVGDLNAACIDGSIRRVLQIAEGRHEKLISEISDQIRDSKRRLVLIAGPSAAGKTTFTKRLSIQLMVNGLRPVSISLDNYYVNRTETPLDATGKYDFEALEAIDLGLFNAHLRRILDGASLLTPRYDFNAGRRSPKKKWIPIELGDDGILIIEGIHGLNDALTPAIPPSEKFRIYVNALNPLAIDEHNRLHTSDTRLIRRMVRDRHYRGYSAAETISSWHSVRRGERKHIFPFQESSDVIFDSSLIYEFSVVKIFAERYLLEVEHTHPSFAEAYRLRKFMSMFVPMLPGDIPQTSLIREFIGGSGFSY